MSIAGGTWVDLAMSVVVFAAGVLIGLLIGRPRLDVRMRVRELEEEINRLQRRNAQYRESVAKHFGETSEKFRDLTEQYTALYRLLAGGAKDLCGDQVPAIRFDRGLLLEGGAEDSTSSPATSASEKATAE
jgi:uncharacterized membrane-anchored protein YhcB (DUF1043 family)